MAEAPDYEEILKESAYDDYLKKTEIRVVMVGKTGNGKSATANTLLGKKAFKSSTFAKSITTNCQFEKVQRFEKSFLIVDTPGFLDTCKDFSSQKAEVEKVIPICSPGIHVFLIILALGRYTSAEIQTVESIIQVFGDDLYHHSVVVFTHKDNLESEEETEEGFIKSMTDPLKKLLKFCGDRYILVDNSPKIGTENRKNEASKLFQYIFDFVKKNEYKYYSDAMFQNVEKRFNVSMEHLLFLTYASNTTTLLEALIKERAEDRKKAANSSNCQIL